MSDPSAFGRRPSADPPQAPSMALARPPGRPIWPGVFIFMVVVYLLQVLPFPGFIMMLMLAPLWPVVMFNLLMIFMIADALKGRTPRFLLAIPVTVYVATLAASGASYLEFKRLERDILADNAAQRVTFDPARMDLMLEGDGETLLSRYAVPVTYTAGGHGQPTMSQRVLPRAVCDSIPKSDDNMAMRISWPFLDGKSATNACTLQLPEEPSRPVLAISTTEAPFDGLLKGRNKETVLRLAGAREARLRAARVEVLPPIPLLVSGCFIGPSKTDWRCQTTLLRVPMTIGDWDSAASGQAVAKALGLKPRIVRAGPNVRYRASLLMDEPQTLALSRGSEAAVVRAQGFAAAEANRQLAMFRGLVAGRPVDNETFREWTVIRHADQLSGEAAAIVSALERIPPGYQGAEARRTLARVAAALPPQAFAAISGRLLRATLADEELGRQSEILVRLGDAGMQAQPLLLSKLQSRRSGDVEAAVQGFCRMGSMAGKEVAEQVAAAARPELADKHPDRGLMEATIVTLARMGRPDLARPFAEPLKGSRKTWAESQLAGITVASPASVCTGHNGRAWLANVPWLKA